MPQILCSISIVLKHDNLLFFFFSGVINVFIKAESQTRVDEGNNSSNDPMQPDYAPVNRDDDDPLLYAVSFLF